MDIGVFRYGGGLENRLFFSVGGEGLGGIAEYRELWLEREGKKLSWGETCHAQRRLPGLVRRRTIQKMGIKTIIRT